MEPSSTENTGTWSATVQSAKNLFTLKVEGKIPTNGQKPIFKLTRIDPQGPNPTELILELSFSHLVDKNGQESETVYYPIDPKEPKILETEDKYKTVLIIGDANGETIANIDIRIPK